MRLAFKLVFAFLLANVLLAALYGYLAVQHEIRVFERMASSEAESLGPALEVLVIDAWRNTGYRGVQDVIRTASRGQPGPLHVRWVWFDAEPGSPDCPAAPAERLTSVVIERHLVIEGIGSDGGEHLDVYWPVHLATDRRGGIEFSQPTIELESNKREIVVQTALVVGGMVLISGIIAAYLGIRLIGSPLRKLIEKTRRVAAGDLEGPVHLQSHDELAELAESLNQMCERLAESQLRIVDESTARIAAMEQLRHADRLKTVGRLAAGIAHELGTPLNVVAGRASLIQSGRLAPEEISLSAAAIKTEADKMTRIIRQLLDFARASTPRMAAIDLRSVVKRTLELLHRLAEERRAELCFDPDGQPVVAQIDADQIQQALTNLVVNAIQAMPNGGKVRIAVCRRTASPPGQTPPRPVDCHCIEICDEGVGISPEDRQHLFEPFFTTKEVGEGTGLGLSIAYGIVREHGGWIDVASRPGEGSCFTIYLPAEPHREA
jgi:two-component system, NtrC family, sensor kinase